MLFTLIAAIVVSVVFSLCFVLNISVLSRFSAVAYVSTKTLWRVALIAGFSFTLSGSLTSAILQRLDGTNPSTLSGVSEIVTSSSGLLLLASVMAFVVPLAISWGSLMYSDSKEDFTLGDYSTLRKGVMALLISVVSLGMPFLYVYIRVQRVSP